MINLNFKVSITFPERKQNETQDVMQVLDYFTHIENVKATFKYCSLLKKQKLLIPKISIIISIY